MSLRFSKLAKLPNTLSSNHELAKWMESDLSDRNWSEQNLVDCIKIWLKVLLSREPSDETQSEWLTNFDVKNVVTADGLTAVVIEFFNMHGNGQTL